MQPIVKNPTDWHRVLSISSREKLNILIDIDGKPFGGKWSLDAENRKKDPKKSSNPRRPPYHVLNITNQSL